MDNTDEIQQLLLKIHLTDLRNQRNKLLVETDKYVLFDYPITPENLILIKDYRQQLRDYMNSSNINTEIIPLPKFPF